MDYTEQSPAILSLCTGMRGIERGLDRAFNQLGWKHARTVAYVEIEAFIIENLVQQMEQGVLDAAPVWSNLKTFPNSEFYGKIHGIIGGYPCQPISNAGQGRGADDPRFIWPYIKTMVGAIKPVWCFFENVRNHLNIGFEQVKEDLEGLGYKVEPGIFSAEEVGAPHKRERLFILAIKMGHTPESGLQIPRFRRFGELSAKERKGVDNRFEQSGCKLANSDSINRGLSKAKERINNIEVASAGELADPNRDDTGTECRGLQKESGPTERAQQREKWHKIFRKRCRDEFRSCRTRWPSRPGQQQYKWEAPRTFVSKPGMGFTVNGYNFREDLLRMAGNGVVEQTAELAFLTLLKKFQS